MLPTFLVGAYIVHMLQREANIIEAFEQAVKKKFIAEPGQMKLLIVVDKLLTGFDSPPATYLYIDKKMQDHGLFQAICRVNRLDGEDKPYGYIIDYTDLFKPLEGAVRDYTSGAFDAFDEDDVKGLLKDRLAEARQDLEEAREAIKALCEPVQQPRDSAAYMRFFCAVESGNAEQLKAKTGEIRESVKEVADIARAAAEEKVHQLQARREYATRTLVEQVHEQPFKTIGAAVGAGFLLGLLFARR